MIRLVAVDMDGTFLNEFSSYDRDKFREIYQDMQRNGIKFVVASGNQYYQLRSFFDEKDHSMIPFVAENGAYVLEGDETLFVGRIDPTIVETGIRLVEPLEDVNMLVCGKKSAYTSDSSTEFYEYAAQYYHRLTKVEHLLPLPDDLFFKFALRVPEEKVAQMLEEIQEKIGQHMVAVSSGHGDIDLIAPQVNKAHGLSFLAEKYAISPEEMVAFGDSGNDFEMLTYVGDSYAMANASEKIKQAAKYLAPANTENGVLTVLEEYRLRDWKKIND